MFKRSGIYQIDRVVNGKRVQRSTKMTNRNDARDVEAVIVAAMAKGEFGILEKKKPADTVKDFLENRFLPFVESGHKEKPKTIAYYRHGVRRLCEYAPLSSKTLPEVTSEMIAGFVASRQAKGRKTSAINRELQVARAALKRAVEWGDISRMPKVTMLPGENKRTRVITQSEEKLYLAAVAEPLKSLATVLLDGGWRPEEMFRADWRNIHWNDRRGPNGSISNLYGKTECARRCIPMSRRVRMIMEERWNAAGRPASGYVWPAPTKSGHIEPSGYRKLHGAAFVRIAKEAQQNGTKPVEPFVLYLLRHTFLTRLGESGCDAWTHSRIAGWGSIAMSMRYVHASDTAAFNAFQKMQPRAMLQSATGGQRHVRTRRLARFAAQK